MQIFLNRGGERSGPLSLEEVNRQIAAGTLSPTEEGWSEGSPGWKPLLSFSGVIMPGGASSTAASIGMAIPVAPPPPRYAGFWIRAAAHAIDCLILAIPAGVVEFLIQSGVNDATAGGSFFATAIIMVMILAYFAGLWSSPMQATLGQKLFGLKVVDVMTRRPISFSRGAGRLLALWLGIAILLLGVLMIALTERKRGLHDVLARTYVVRAER
jgi:uncharacterized RDD family membrane protein YckC